MANDSLRIHKEFHLRRHLKLCSRCLSVLPYPAEVTGLTMIRYKYEGLGWKDIVGDVGTEFVPYKIKRVCRPNLWRVGMEFVGDGLTCHLTPNSTLWRLNVSV
jgi:hypothetical protein